MGMAMARFLLLLALLGGCGPAVTSLTQDRAYSPSEFRHAAGGKGLYTVIRGNPFEVADAALAVEVIAAMQDAGQIFDTALVRHTRFTTDPGPRSRPEYRVAVVFNPENEDNPADFCTGGNAGMAEKSERIVARMVFCRGRAVLSTSRGAIDAVLSPADTEFQHMIALMTRNLFPHRDYRGGDRDQRRRE